MPQVEMTLEQIRAVLEAAVNGTAALAAIQRKPPVMSDALVDGLAALKAHTEAS